MAYSKQATKSQNKSYGPISKEIFTLSCPACQDSRNEEPGPRTNRSANPYIGPLETETAALQGSRMAPPALTALFSGRFAFPKFLHGQNADCVCSVFMLVFMPWGLILHLSSNSPCKLQPAWVGSWG